MNIEMRDIIKLSDSNKYVVCSKTIYQEKNYLYLIDLANNENVKFGMEKQKGDKMIIVEIEDADLIRQLLPLFFEKAKIIINDEGW